MISRRLVLLPLVFLVVSCASSGVDRSSRAATAMKNATELLTKSRAQLDATNSALDRLTASSGKDLRKAFDNYAKQVKKQSDLASELVEARTRAMNRRDEYFEGWTKDAASIQDPELKRLALERRDSMNEAAGALIGSFESVKAALDTYLVSLRDIEKFLGNELTDGNVATLASTGKVAQVKTDSDLLRDRLGEAERVVADVRLRLEPGAMGQQPTTANP